MSIYPRVTYEMTQEDLDRILDACKPVPYMVIGGHAPSSPQDNANAAWSALGRKMGFDYMTVQPDGRSSRSFTAIPSETEQQRKERIEREKEVVRLAEIARLDKVIADATAARAAMAKEQE